MNNDQEAKVEEFSDLLIDLGRRRSLLVDFDIPRAYRALDKAKGTNKEKRQQSRLFNLQSKLRDIDAQVVELKKPRNKNADRAMHILMAQTTGLIAGLQGI